MHCNLRIISEIKTRFIYAFDVDGKQDGES